MKTVKIPCTGYELAADLYSGSKNQILLVLPGYTSTKAKYAQMIESLTTKSGYSALVLDYGGHGDSPFKLEDLTRAQNFSEVVHAFDWIVENYPNLEITVMGTSYGGFHATYLTKYRRFSNLILRVPASYPEDTLYTRIGDMEDPHGGDYRFKPENYVNHWLFTNTDSVSGRRLVITHEFDDICPPASTKPFADAFDADEWVAKGFSHGLGQSEVSDEQIMDYYEKIIEWLNK